MSENSEPRIESRTSRPIELDKRTYLPFAVVVTCPKCGIEDERDLTSNYLSYPIIGQPIDVHFECEDGCGHSYSVRVVVGFTLTVAPPEVAEAGR